jgi:hypothetical protein
MRTDELVHKASRGVRTIIRLALGALFVYSGWVKLRQPKPAADFLASVLYTDVAWAIPIVAAIELALGLWLLLGVRVDRSATAAFGMFLCFGALHAFALVTPTSTPTCGCLGQVEAVRNWPVGVWLALNGFLALVAGILAMTSVRSRAGRRMVVHEQKGGGREAKLS